MRKPPDVTPPVDITPRKLDIIEQKRTYELITPLYGGGVGNDETKKAEPDPITVVRAPEIRGQLRFWWRACRGWKSNGDPAAMKTEEDAIWGKAYEKGDKGIHPNQTVQLVVDISQVGTPIKPFRMNGRTPVPINGIPGYVAFPLQPDQNERKKAKPFIPDLQKGVQFILTISYPTGLSEEIEAALWAWETFGGIGARTRRGFGALHLLKVDGPPYPSLPSSRDDVERWIKDTALKYIKTGRFLPNLPHLNSKMQLVVTFPYPPNDPMQAWDDLITKLQDFRQQKDESNPDTLHEKHYNKRSAWPEADTIRKIAGKDAAPDATKFPRAAFGLPIKFHFTGKNAPPGDYTLNEANPNHEDRPNKERFASPLILRPFLCSNGHAVGLALLLEGSRVDLERLVLQNDSKSLQALDGEFILDGILDKKEANKLTKKIPALNYEIDVLKAFMQSLKGVRYNE